MPCSSPSEYLCLFNLCLDALVKAIVHHLTWYCSDISLINIPRSRGKSVHIYSISKSMRLQNKLQSSVSSHRREVTWSKKHSAVQSEAFPTSYVTFKVNTKCVSSGWATLLHKCDTDTGLSLETRMEFARCAFWNILIPCSNIYSLLLFSVQLAAPSCPPFVLRLGVKWTWLHIRGSAKPSLPASAPVSFSPLLIPSCSSPLNHID